MCRILSSQPASSFHLSYKLSPARRPRDEHQARSRVLGHPRRDRPRGEQAARPLSHRAPRRGPAHRRRHAQFHVIAALRLPHLRQRNSRPSRRASRAERQAAPARRRSSGSGGVSPALANGRNQIARFSQSLPPCSMEILPGSATLHLASRHSFRTDWEGRLPATPNALLGWALAGLLLAGEVALADDAVDLAAAEQQFLKSCGTCHTVEPNAPVRQGPNLRSVVGRTAGTLAEFPTLFRRRKEGGRRRTGVERRHAGKMDLERGRIHTGLGDALFAARSGKTQTRHRVS